MLLHCDLRSGQSLRWPPVSLPAWHSCLHVVLCTYCMKIGLCDQQNSMGMYLQEVIGILQICLSVWDHVLWGSCQVMRRPHHKELRSPANNHMSDLTSKSFNPGRIQMIDNPADIWTATPLETPGQSTPRKPFHNFLLINFK